MDYGSVRADAIDLLVRVATVLFPQDRQNFCELPKNRVLSVMDLPAEGQAKRRRRAEISVTISSQSCSATQILGLLEKLGFFPVTALV